MIELVVLITMVYSFAAVCALRGMWLRHLDRLRAKWVARTLDDITGKPVSVAVTQFGSPFEVIEGSGKRFYVWKSPPSHNFPEGTGLLIVNVIANDAGRVLQSSWFTR